MKAKDFVSEQNGQGSSMRLAMWFGFLIGAVISAYAAATDKPDLIPLVALWVTVTTAGKVVQKFGEDKPDVL
jgi:hypothetical protein